MNNIIINAIINFKNKPKNTLMRQEDISNLNKPYTTSEENMDSRFYSSIGADIPSARKLLKEIFHDLDTKSFGISWWKNMPNEERILISDYLYQCADGIEKNLAEAKLHYLEWLDAREKHNDKIANIGKMINNKVEVKMPSSNKPIDDLPNKLEDMHICGFFQSIGSSLDCIGAVIIGVLGLSKSIRKADIQIARNHLKELSTVSTTPKEQINFYSFLESSITDSGPEDWLEWAIQYRNMFIHRGRRIMHNQLLPCDIVLYDSHNQRILRMTSTQHLALHPAKSDVEALIKEQSILNEDADITLKGIFNSCKELEERICEHLVVIWQERRNNKLIIEQPSSQWDTKIRPCKFSGYKSDSTPIKTTKLIVNPIIGVRIRSASLDDTNRSLWENTKYNQ